MEFNNYFCECIFDFKLNKKPQFKIEICKTMAINQLAAGVARLTPSHM